MTTLVDAVAEFLEARRAEGISEKTLTTYNFGLKKLIAHLGEEKDLQTITPRDVRSFLAAQNKVTNTTKLNYHTAMASMWKWLENEGLCKENIMRKVNAPRPEKREVVPFTKEQLLALILSCDLSKPYKRGKQRQTCHATQNAKRDRALLYVMLDTGMRVSELCGFRVQDLTAASVKVFGKGSKERILPITETTHGFIWIYLDERRGELKKTDLVFPISRSGVLQAMTRLEQRSGVSDVHPHRFRHTFAISFLRNGGDIFTLQKLMGHTTLDMVKRYLAIAQMDLERVHAKASPVTNFGL